LSAKRLRRAKKSDNSQRTQSGEFKVEKTSSRKKKKKDALHEYQGNVLRVVPTLQVTKKKMPKRDKRT